MIDIKLIRENYNLVKANVKKKFQNDKAKLVDEVKKLDEQWRAIKAKADRLRHDRNKISKEINRLIKSRKQEQAKALIKKAKIIPNKIKDIENKTKSLEKKIKNLLSQIPNMISKKTPSGKDETKNKVIKKHGKIPKFKFKVKNHVELLENLEVIDFDASGKVSGNGFYYLKGKLALLNQALIKFAIDFMKSKKYEYIETPLMLNEKAIYASMDKKAIEDSVYSIKGEDLNLIGTAEQSLLAMHTGKTFKERRCCCRWFGIQETEDKRFCQYFK